MSKTLTRSKDRMIGGVCAGLAEYFDFDKSLVRLAYLLLVLLGGTGILLYLILWIIMPSE